LRELVETNDLEAVLPLETVSPESLPGEGQWRAALLEARPPLSYTAVADDYGLQKNFRSIFFCGLLGASAIQSIRWPMTRCVGAMVYPVNYMARSYRNVVAVRISDELLSVLRRRAGSSGLAMAATLRDCIRGGLPAGEFSEEEMERWRKDEAMVEALTTGGH
jgi:hypothetical protein